MGVATIDNIDARVERRRATGKPTPSERSESKGGGSDDGEHEEDAEDSDDSFLRENALKFQLYHNIFMPDVRSDFHEHVHCAAECLDRADHLLAAVDEAALAHKEEIEKDWLELFDMKIVLESIRDDPAAVDVFARVLGIAQRGNYTPEDKRSILKHERTDDNASRIVMIFQRARLLQQRSISCIAADRIEEVRKQLFALGFFDEEQEESAVKKDVH